MDHQCGFRRNRSTTDHIFLYTLLTDQIRKGGVRKDLVKKDIIVITVQNSQHFF